MRLGTHFAVAALIFTPAVTATGQAAPRRAPAAQQSTPVTAAEYRTEWSKVQSCEQFKLKLWTLPTADNLLEPVVSSAVAVKSEFESNVQFQDRTERKLSPLIKADSVYLIHSLKGDWSSYDAERQQMTVEFPSYTRSGYIPVGFDVKRRTARGSTYTGTNAFGVSKTVQRQTRVTTKVEYTFPAVVTSQSIRFPMNGNDAEMFKMGIGTMHILARIVGTNIRRGRTTPTLDRPNETVYTQYEITMQPRCAYITFGPELIETWGYNAW